MTNQVIPSKSSARVLSTLAVLAVFAAWSTVAQAVSYPMAGTWAQQRGVSPIPRSGIIENIAGATVSVTGASPATINVPDGAFAGTFGATSPIPVDSIIQLSTHFTVSGPAAVVVTARKGILQSYHWAASGSAAKSAGFAFCPGATGAAIGNCTDRRRVDQGAAPGQGTKHGLVIYTPGAKKFGGVMQMLLLGGGSTSNIVQVSPQQVAHNPFGGAGTSPQAHGGPYSNLITNFLSSGVITQSPILNGSGVIQTGGLYIGPGTAGQTNSNTGFPWTTGTVKVSGSDPGPGFVTQTVNTLSGADNRSVAGRGTITLVSGAVTERNLTAGGTRTFMSYDQVDMVIGPRALPVMSLLGYVATGGLIITSAGYVLRRRLTS